MVEPGGTHKHERRVTFVATSYPRDPDDPAGHFVRAEVLVQRDAGDRVSVVAPAPAHDPGVTRWPAGAASLFRWPGASARVREWPPRLALSAPFAARAALAIGASRPDVIVAHWLVPSAWPLAFASSGELRVVCHGADVRVLLGLAAPLRSRIVASLMDRDARFRFVASSLFEALSSALPRELASRLEARAVVRPPLVQVSDVAEVKRPERPYAVVLGRLVRSKCVDVAIEACRLAAIDLVIIGSGPEMPRLQRASGERVRFLGQLGRRSSLGHLGAGSVLLHPSRVDAAPTAVIEARAFALPVITCGAGDTGRWADTDPGIRVVPREPRALAAALLEFDPPRPVNVGAVG